MNIVEVSTKKQTKRFVKLLWHLYRGDPNWVPPFISDELTMLAPDGPFFEHGEGQLFIAERDGEPVGRIAALIDTHSPETEVGNIGYFECIDDETVAAALFERAEDWLRTHGRTRARGPLSPTLLTGITGIFVEGEGGPPTIAMPYNPPYYSKLYDACGYERGMDLYAYWGKLADAPLEAGRAAIAKFERDGFVFRPCNKKTLVADMERLVEIHNDAYSSTGHYAFAPATKGEARYLAGAFKDVIDPDVFVFCEKDGKVVGVMVAVPDAAPVLQALNGRLGPIRLWRALRAQKRIKRVRGADFAVDPAIQHQSLGIALATYGIEGALRKGYEDAEYSWICDDNMPSRKTAEHFGAEIVRTYRLYEKPLSS